MINLLSLLTVVEYTALSIRRDHSAVHRLERRIPIQPRPAQGLQQTRCTCKPAPWLRLVEGHRDQRNTASTCAMCFHIIVSGPYCEQTQCWAIHHHQPSPQFITAAPRPSLCYITL